jgi:site-specific DNA recombinase
MASYIIYCRKSTESEEKQVLSIESQLKELNELSQRLDLPVSDVLTESRSAKYPGRPIFAHLLKRVAKGEVKGIISWKLDRLARNPVDGGELVMALDRGQIEEIVTPNSRLHNNSNDKFLMQLEFGMAKKYVDDLSDNVKRGNRMKVEKGWMPGRAPIGYLNEPLDHTIIPDPDRFAIIRQMWDLLLQGCPPSRIHRIAKDEFGLRNRKRPPKMGNPLCLSSTYRLFTNPFYYGVIEYNGMVYQGKHQPMITEGEFWRAQDHLGLRGKPRAKIHEFAFTGLMKCGECGCSITAEEHTNRYGSHYTYYHCTKKKTDVNCHQKYIGSQELERQMTDYLDRIHISDSLHDFVLSYLDQEQAESAETEAVYIHSNEKALQDCRRKLENLNRMRLNELINDEEYLKEKRSLLDEKLSLEGDLAQRNSVGETVVELTRKAFALAGIAKERFLGGSPDEKKTILKDIGSNFLLKDKKLIIDLIKPFHLIEKVHSTPCAKNQRFEPQENVMNTNLLGAPRPQFPIWGALVEDVRTFYEEEIKAGRYHEFSIGDSNTQRK